jgi:NAD-dependent DNA ligase
MSMPDTCRNCGRPLFEHEPVNLRCPGNRLCNYLQPASESFLWGFDRWLDAFGKASLKEGVK